jgi:parallel beta-helix repeat protein
MDDNDQWEAENSRGATLKLQASADCHIIENSDIAAGNTGLSLKGFIIDGNGSNQDADPNVFTDTGGSWSSCVHWKNVNNSSIKDCEIKNGYDSCVKLNGTDATTCSYSNEISSCYLHNSLNYSVLWMRAAQKNRIKDNHISYGAYGCLVASQGNGIGCFTHSSYNTISGNVIENNLKCGIGMGGANGTPLPDVPNGPCYSNTISNNECLNNTESGIDLHDTADRNTVTANQSYANEHGISLIESNYNTVTANHCYLNTGNGIYLSVVDLAYPCKHNTIAANIIYKNGKNGIYLGGATCNMITSNQILDNSTAEAGTYYGIHLFSGSSKNSRYNQIANNIIYDTATVGASTTQRVPIYEATSATTNNRILNNSAGFQYAHMYATAPLLASASTITLTQGCRLVMITGAEAIYSITPPAGIAPAEEYTLLFRNDATLVDPVAAVSIESLTSSGITATCDTDGAHSFVTGDGVVIASCDNWQYNGYHVIVSAPVASNDIFTFYFPGCSVSPDPDSAVAKVSKGNIRIRGTVGGADMTFHKLIWDGVYWNEIASSNVGY